tara:strand:+ start:1946 stop:3022 length:1077 start_codon:yes stop_codon:yes gene_type:complete
VHNYEKLESFLKKNCLAYSQDYDIKSHSYSKTGYLVKIFIMPKTEIELQSIIQYLVCNLIEYKVIGETTNILFLDSVIYSIFISTQLLKKIEFFDDYVTVECGKNLPDFVREVAMRGYEGFEGLEGIPGTLGGAVFMNAGAYGAVISSNIINVKCINSKGELVKLLKSEINFGRRTSFFKENEDWLILSIDFKINKGNPEAIYSKIERFHIARHKYQEWVYPNLGSIYSSDYSIYDSTVEKDNYRLKLSVIRNIFYNNPIGRYFNRRQPSNEKLNKLFLSHYSLNKYSKLVSKKNINTFVNVNYSSLEIVDFIYQLGRCLNSGTYLENELVCSPIYKIVSKDSFDKIVELKNIINNKV